VQADDDDDETLEPHADENYAGDEEQRDGTGAQSANPEHLRNKNIADEQRPVSPHIGAMQSIPEGEGVVAVSAVPAHKGLNTVTVGYDQSGGEHDFCGILQVALGDEIFQSVDFSDRNREHQHHCEPGIDCTGDEVGRENCCVPSRYDADGEIEADDGMHREHKRRGQSGQQQVHSFVAMPVAGRSAPAERERAVYYPRRGMGGAITQRRQIRDKADEPE